MLGERLNERKWNVFQPVPLPSLVVIQHVDHVFVTWMERKRNIHVKPQRVLMGYFRAEEPGKREESHVFYLRTYLNWPLVFGIFSVHYLWYWARRTAFCYSRNSSLKPVLSRPLQWIPEANVGVALVCDKLSCALPCPESRSQLCHII